MRISVLHHDPGYSPDAYKIEVFFNGERQTDCVIADDEAGKIWSYDLTPQGCIIMDDIGNPKIICKTGEVKIVFPEESTAHQDLPPKNRVHAYKKRHTGESLQDFKARRKASNKKRREREAHRV